MLAPGTASKKASVNHGDGDSLPLVLDETMAALREAGIQFLLIGGVGSCVFGRDRGTQDIDVFVRPETAEDALAALAARGFRTKKEYEHWLYKAWKDDVLVDVIFRSSRDILLDQEMLDRARMVTFRGREIPVAPPEDLVVMKAIAASEDTPRYWYDAIAMIAQTELDWDYLVARARQRGARRILSLLLFADSVDLVVPPEPIEALFEAVGSRRPA